MGVKKILIINGHYENESFICEAAEIVSRNETISIISLSWWNLISNDYIHSLFPGFVSWDREHAGVCETSLMLYLQPNLVRYINSECDNKLNYGIYKNNQKQNLQRLNNGVLSSSIGANKALGEALYSEIINKLNSDILSIL